MPNPVGTAPYESTIATLSDGASIVEAFKYYHTGGLTGSIFPNSIQYHIQTINARADTLNSQIGYTGISPAPASVHARLNTLETTVGTSLSSTYVKMIPSSNDTSATRNFITPATSTIIPMTIQGVVGQSVNLQEWRTSAALVARVDQTGKLFSHDGTSMAETVTITGTQTLTNKTLTSPIQIIATNPRVASYDLILSDQSKIIEMNVATANTLTIPPNSGVGGVAFPVGTYIIVMQTGAGQVTLSPAVGVTVNATPGLKIRTQWSMVSLIKRDTNLWIASGDLIA